MNSNKTIFKILRFDPSIDETPYFERYEICCDTDITVLDGLIKIQRDLDHSLCFRCSCMIGKCGTCTMKVEGKPVLSCMTLAKVPELIVEPLDNHTILKDLIVDLEMTRKLKSPLDSTAMCNNK